MAEPAEGERCNMCLFFLISVFFSTVCFFKRWLVLFLYSFVFRFTHFTQHSKGFPYSKMSSCRFPVHPSDTACLAGLLLASSSVLRTRVWHSRRSINMDQMNIFQVVQLIKPFPEVGLEDICFPSVCHLKLVGGDEGSTSWSLRAKSGILPVSVNKVLLEHSSGHSLA